MIIQQKDKDYDIMIRVYKNKAGEPARLCGYAVHPNSTQRCSNQSATIKVLNSNTLDDCRLAIIKRVQSFYKEKESSNFIDFKKIDIESSLYKCHSMFINEYDHIQGWKQETTYTQFMSKFEKRLLPYLSHYSSIEEFTISDRKQLLELLKTKVESDKRSNKQDFITERNIISFLRQADYYLSVLKEYYPNYSFPDYNLSDGIRAKRKTLANEQLKVLNKNVRRLFIQALHKDIKRFPRLVYSAVCMLFGLRTAEAAGQNPIDRTQIAGLDILSVFFQETNESRDPYLKTDSSYRRIPLPGWAGRMLDQCLEQIGEMEPDKVMSTSEKLSKYVLKKLEECGLDETFINDSDKDRIKCGDSKMYGPYEVSAYILRRDFASRAKNICGFSSNEIDWYLGHSSHDSSNAKIDFASEKILKKIFLKLERFVYDFQQTTNPGWHPVDVSESEIFELEFPRFKLTSSKRVRVKIYAETCEPGENLTIKSRPIIDLKERNKVRTDYNKKIREVIAREENSC